MSKHWNLYIKRKEHGLSQKSVAKVIGVSMGNYQLKESCKLDFTLKECHTLAEYFDTTLNDLFPKEPSKDVG
ncbi:helix-turn-helix transcriptional regulator [Macrococcus animalis]|uniref:helix-turn-helix transcriptional regulator n=1 Tax=Macrococcus animalis TaxID=3395467 RepID=UPI0039BE2115